MQVWASKVEASFAGSGTAVRELEAEAQSKRLRFPSADRYIVKTCQDNQIRQISQSSEIKPTQLSGVSLGPT